MEVSGVCVDTSAYSHLKRGRDTLRLRLEEADSVYVPATVLGELFAGFEQGARRDENALELREFLLQPAVTVVSADENVAERYGKVVQQLRAQGTPIPTNDIWVSAAALETGSRLLSYDSHFEHVPGLIVESP
ncbi:MAG: VapC toxin family PIN domain ribonuclease [Gemmatimonadaceae bacterium]|jgi:predicted nucleic acid-binding protein|nr:VapC toxin family PIN domain ribonuclease [Gemmatimonadaceae bacterium]